MAKIGQYLPQPENGWERYEVESPNVTMSNDTWTADTMSTNSEGKAFYTTSKTASYKFKFVGSSFRIISRLWHTQYHTNNSVYVDGVLHGNFTLMDSSGTYSAIVYEANNLEPKEHTVEVRSGDSGTYFWADAVDILKPIKRLIVKNEETNQHYSLSDSTLIHLPDNTTESIIEHGVEQGTFIQLDVPFNKKSYPINEGVTLGIGKVFEVGIGNKKEITNTFIREVI